MGEFITWLLACALCLVAGTIAGFYLTGRKGLHRITARNIHRWIRRNPLPTALLTVGVLDAVVLLTISKFGNSFRVSQTLAIATITGLTGVLGSVTGAIYGARGIQSAAREDHLRETLVQLQSEVSNLALWLSAPSQYGPDSMNEQRRLVESIGSGALRSLDSILYDFANKLAKTANSYAAILENLPDEDGQILDWDERFSILEKQRPEVDRKIGAINLRIRELLFLGTTGLIFDLNEGPRVIRKLIDERDQMAKR